MKHIFKDRNRLFLVCILVIASFLRLWRLSDVPVSLFGDELDVGYHAYSILKTGRDYSGNFMPLHFQSLAEFRTPLYLYSSAPTVALFGISPLGVRLPAAIFGIFGVWGMYLLTKEFLKIGKFSNSLEIGNWKLENIASFLLAISPWHIQYSRAAFEVTQLLFFYIFGLYFFFKSFEKGKLLWLSALCFGLTPWVYSSAKFFTPLLLAFLFIVWFKPIIKISKKQLFYALFILLITGLPMAYTIAKGGGAQRFNYISVFTDPTMEGDVGFARLNDAKMRQAYSGDNVVAKLFSRIAHNKYTFWGEKITGNFFKSLSTEFLFIKGDINLRHSIENMGQFYKIEIIPLLIGIISFFLLFKDKKIKFLIAFWIIAGIIPAAITRDGGGHATRLFIILPPLIILISCGLLYLGIGFKYLSKYLLFVYLLLLIASFISFQHNYWIHNPWYSERWWHAGFSEMIQSVKEVENSYDKIIISNANEPPKIFFAAWYQYPPSGWQKGTIQKYVEGFDTMETIGKFYFGQVGEEGIYGLPKFLNDKTLYVAVEREVGFNLIMDPTRVPPGLKLVKAIPYPSGEPAFYLFTKSPK